MAGQMENLRTMQVTTADGKDVKQTQQLKGEAKRSPVETEVNQTKEYVSNNPTGGGGPWGGENASK